MLPSKLTTEEQSQLATLLAENSVLPPVELWQRCTRFLRDTKAGPAGYYTVWQTCFANWPADEFGPPPMWSPDADEIRMTNASHWAKQSAVDIGELHAWTVNHREPFWSQAVETAGH